MIGREFLTELKEAAYRHNEEEIVFITKDTEGNLIWLERGNCKAGLQHIITKHSTDFKRAFGIEQEEIALYLYNTVTYGKIVKEYRSQNNGGGLDRTYEYDGNYYTFVGLGDNGFIVTSFPARK